MLHDDVAATRERNAALEARGAELQKKLADVSAVVDAETDDFARLAGARAVRTEMLLALAEIAAKSERATKEAAAAEQALTSAWASVQGARHLAESPAVHGDDAHYRLDWRGPHRWESLSRNLDPVGGGRP